MPVTDRPKAEMSLNAIETKDLVKTYKNSVRALNGLSLAVKSGSIFALLGPNGAGKSTTVKILTTLSIPDSGEARVAGFDVTREPQKVRRAIGCVAQRSGVDSGSTGRENLTLQGHFHGMRSAELKSRVDELLAQFSLTEAADRLAQTYSGGMQRKLDIATALIHRPSVLFLDEPTTGLDPEARSELWSEIARLSKGGLTILLTTHYLEEADKLAQYVAIADRGRVVAEGSPEELKAELRGDSVQLDLANAQEGARVRSALRDVQGLRDMEITGTLLQARADHGATAVPGMLLALQASGIGVTSVKVSRPTLDDVYLRHTGRTLAQAEGSQN
jgi:ABC-2 type transport system ATP-binding protein